jgi:RNA polymerase sigma-70 factor (ECF subfamily)
MLHQLRTDAARQPEAADDAAVVGQVLNGQPAAFERIVERYHRMLFNVAYRMLGDREEASDATQDALVKAYQKLDTYDPQYRFFSWLYRILVNECLNVRRARRPHEALSNARVDTTVGVQETLEADERHRQLQSAILTLPRDYREVIVLRYFAEMSYDDIAAAAGVPAKTVKSRLHTARQRLAELLLPT